ncbi:MAG: sodium/solute symporter [Ignavibacteria bacterium]|jgi:SSS family solute:Na+ symporter
MNLISIDYFIVFLYLAGTIAVGLYYEKYISSSSDYFLAGKLLPFWAIAISIVGSDIGAVDFVGLTGQAYRYGIVVANFDWIGSVPAMIIAGLIFIPYYWRAGVYTIPEYLGRRYNVYLRALSAVIWLIFIAFTLGVILWATGVLLQEMLGWPIILSIIMTVVVVGIYTITGGLSAVVMTDVIQVVIMIIGSLAILVLEFWEIGGVGLLFDKVRAMGPQYANHFSLVVSTETNTPYPWTGILFGLTFVLAPAYFIGNQVIIQRSLGAKDEWNAKASMIFGAFLKVLIPILVVIPGLIAVVLFPNAEDGDGVYAKLIKELLPPGLTGLVFAAFLAALMSSVSAIVNSVATVWTKDIYELFIKKDADDKHYLVVGRYVTGLILILAVITSPLSDQFPGIYVYVQTINSFVQGPIFAVLLLGIFIKRVTQWGGLFGLISGIIFSGILYNIKESLFSIDDPFLYISWWSFLGSVIVTLLVSVFTKPDPVEKLRGLVYGLILNDNDLQERLKSKVE